MDGVKKSSLNWGYGIGQLCSYGALHLTRRV